VPATPFLDLLFPYVSNQSQNGNQGSILAYSLFGRFLVTGLIGALLSTFFQIPVIRAWNPKSPVLRGGKPVLLFPIGWQIAV
jgi:predicted benzoate:H+ symporter BenE